MKATAAKVQSKKTKISSTKVADKMAAITRVHKEASWMFADDGEVSTVHNYVCMYVLKTTMYVHMDHHTNFNHEYHLTVSIQFPSFYYKPVCYM